MPTTSSRPESEKKPLLIIGRIGKTYGVKGFLKIHSFTEPSTNFLDYGPWFVASPCLSRHQKPPSVLFNLIHCQLHGNFLIGQIENCLTPEKAKRYVNFSIHVFKEKLPPLDNHNVYQVDIIGLAVYNLKQIYLGKVIDILETGANNVLVVKNTVNSLNTEILIPHVPDQYIKKIDLNKGQMLVDWELDWL